MKIEPKNKVKSNKVACASSMRLSLESRLLFDGAVVAMVTEVMDDKASQGQTQDVGKDANPEIGSLNLLDSPKSQTDYGNFADIKSFGKQPLAIASAISIENKEASHLIVVDSRATGVQELIAHPPKDTDIRVIDSTTDGYQKITEILQDRSKTTDLHILTANIDGKPWLGSSQIASTLAVAQNEFIVDWGDNFAANSRVTFHGEQVAPQPSWLNQIQSLTGSRVAWVQNDREGNGYVKLNDTSRNADGLSAREPVKGSVNLVFVDDHVNDYQALLKGIDPDATVVLLDSDKDGVDQIAQTVAQYAHVDAIHIISHGDQGTLHVGSSVLDKASMQGQYAGRFAQIGQHLSQDADILIYGCNFGRDEVGEGVIQLLSKLTGADVAASNNFTGAANLGGDWELENKFGQIESRIIINDQVQQSYGDVLRSPNTPISGVNNPPNSRYTGKLADTFKVTGLHASITSDVVGGKQVIQLTTPVASVNPPVDYQAGSAWSNFQIDLSKNFTIDFDVYLGTKDVNGADGIAFALQNSGPDVTGGFGGGLGVRNISNALAIEFDTWKNNDALPVADLNNDHISMYLPTTPTFSGRSLGSSQQKDLGNIEDGRWYNCVVNWNAATHTISYTFAGPAGSGAGGATGIVTDSAVIDPDTVFGDNNVYFGWTAATGGAVNDQRVSINSLTNLSPTIDLNGNGGGIDKTITFTENGSAISIADSGTLVTDADNDDMQSATIVLTDKKALDQLLVGGSSAVSGTINGLSYTKVDNGASITIKLSGSASNETYATAIKSITFVNTSERPSASDRHVRVTVNDGSINSSPAITTIKVLPVNDPPAGIDKTISIDEDAIYKVTKNDFGFSDPLENPDNAFSNVVITKLPPASQGVYKLNGIAVTLNQVISVADISAGLLTFTPKAEVSGASLGALNFKVQDNGGTANGGINTDPTANTLKFSITPINDPPLAISSTYTGNEDSPIPVRLTGTDPDGRVTAVTVKSLPPATQGILYLADGKTLVVAGKPLTPAQATGLIFKPAPNFNGTVNIPFTVTDNQGAISDPATAKVTVTPLNDPPVAISGSVNTPEDTPVKVNLKGTDVDGTVTGVTVTALPSASQGVLYLADGATPIAAGDELTPAQAASLVFKPALNFNGLVDISFTVKDNTGLVSATGKYVVDVNEVNDDPVATPTEVKGKEDTPVSLVLTGTDVEGPIAAVTVTKLPPASQGILTKADGTPVVEGIPLTPKEAEGLKFVPAPNFTGTLKIPFTVTDSDGQISSPPADATVTITPENDPPVALSTSPAGDEDSPIPVRLTGTDVDGTVTSVIVKSLPPASEGILYLADGKTLVVAGTPLIPAQAAGLIFKPAPNFNGVVNIPFTVTDNEGAISEPAKAAITVLPVNDPPVAISDSVNTPEDTPVKVNLTGTDVDGQVTGVTVTALPPASQGVLYLADGKTPVAAGVELTPEQAAVLVFKPALNFNGLVDIPFTVKDDAGLQSNPATFVVDVSLVDDDPIAIPTIVNGLKNTPVPVTLTGIDVEGPITAVTVSKLPPASQGILTKADGTPVVAGIPLTPTEAEGLKFVSAPNFTGSLNIPFTVTDYVGQVSSPPANLTINISNSENIGPLILLSNPTPPLFPPVVKEINPLIPLPDTGANRISDNPYQLPHLSLYQGLPECDLYLTGSLRNQVVQEKQHFSFSIPPGAFRHTNGTENLDYEATRLDGKPLPNWLSFHSNRLRFSGVPPKGAPNTDVLVTARDHCGNRVYATFRVKVNKEGLHNSKAYLKKDKVPHRLDKISQVGTQQPIMIGKSSLNEQVCSSGKLSRLMESRNLLNSLENL